MTFIWPELLWALLLVPLLVALYVYLLQRKKKVALRYSALLLTTASSGLPWAARRHLPPLLFLLAIIAMIVAMARPAAVIAVPSQQKTVMLAIDVSGSMRATDVQPSRLVAAQAAARTFIEEQPRSTRVGVVAFAATALVIQQPTSNREEMLSAIDRLHLQRGTAVGSGIVVALAAIFPQARITLESVRGEATAKRAGRSSAIDEPTKAESEPFKPVPPGSYPSAAIILLTDGQRTTGPDVIEAARLASERGVRIYTVGVGSPDGEVMSFEGWRMRVRLDEETLKSVAGLTHGEYFQARNAADLKKVYRSLNSRFLMERKETEISALFAGLAAVFALTAGTLSMMWFNRIL